LGDLLRKSVEPMADAAGIPPRDLQEFLSLYRWDASAMRDRLQQLVARRPCRIGNTFKIGEWAGPGSCRG